jgi:hypothetical protein
MTTKNHKLPTGILILVLLGMTACASVYDDRVVAMKMVNALITPQKFLDEKKTEKVNVKNEPTYSTGTILLREPAKNILELDVKF